MSRLIVLIALLLTTAQCFAPPFRVIRGKPWAIKTGGGGGGGGGSPAYDFQTNTAASATVSGRVLNVNIGAGTKPLVYILANIYNLSGGTMQATNITTGSNLVQRFITNSYNTALGFQGWTDPSPATGNNLYMVTNRNGSSWVEYAIGALKFTNVNTTPLGTVDHNYTISSRTAVTNNVSTAAGDLVLFVVGNNRAAQGTAGSGLNLIADSNDGADDASWIAWWKTASAGTTEAESHSWTSGILVGMGEAIKAP